jgi:hypothetical protein
VNNILKGLGTTPRTSCSRRLTRPGRVRDDVPPHLVVVTRRPGHWARADVDDVVSFVARRALVRRPSYARPSPVARRALVRRRTQSISTRGGEEGLGTYLPAGGWSHHLPRPFSTVGRPPSSSAPSSVVHPGRRPSSPLLDACRRHRYGVAHWPPPVMTALVCESCVVVAVERVSSA